MTSRDEADLLDRKDPLASFRHRFFLPPGRSREASVYLAGHSLGLQAFDVRSAVESILDDWAEFGVRGWSDAAPAWTRLEDPMARLVAPLVGAEPSEVCITGSLTANLHALLASFYRPAPGRHAVLVEHDPFPSDRYAVEGQAGLHGFGPAVVEAAAAAPGETSRDAVLRAIGEHGGRLALVLIGAVNYLTGEFFEPEPIVRAAHGHGIPVGFDLAHAVGNVPMALHDAGADFAVWCGYKYLCGGPGAPGGLFVHARHHGRPDLPRLAGWWGHRLEGRFDMPDRFDPDPGAAGWQVSAPPVLGMAPLRASLRIHAEATLPALRAKSVLLTGFLERQLVERLAGRVEILTPRSPDHRGAQLSIRVLAGGRQAFERLASADIVCDWRRPDVIRVAPAPLYNTFGEICDFVDALDSATRA